MRYKEDQEMIKLSETITLIPTNNEVFVDVEHVERLVQDLCDDDLVYLSNVLNKMLQSKHCY
ncbi:MAG: hypothetical protein RR623_00785 [Bacilli bacterium]